MLVPLDGSGFGECALEHMKAIATGCNVPEVDLLFVVEPIPATATTTYARSVEGQEKLMALGKGYLAKIERSLLKEGVTAKSFVVEGKPAETILDFAAKNNIDLIVMSTHGRSGPSRWALGSVADKVIRSSTVPVLIAVPKGCRIS
jgi:nucleotide-binding universal stress UspA family protein